MPPKVIPPWAGPLRPRATQSWSNVPEIYSLSPATGRDTGGTSVTITGLNFAYNADGSAPEVLFDGEPATNVVVVDQNTITADTPAGTAGAAVDVSVTVEGRTGTLEAAFVYFAVRVMSIDPSFGPTTGGTAVVITGINFQAGSTVFFGSEEADDVVVVDGEHITAVTPPALDFGSVDVTVQDAGGDAVLLNGFRYTLLQRGDDIRRSPGIQVRDVINNTPNTCTFSIDGRSSPPDIGEFVAITSTPTGLLGTTYEQETLLDRPLVYLRMNDDDFQPVVADQTRFQRDARFNSARAPQTELTPQTLFKFTTPRITGANDWIALPDDDDLDLTGDYSLEIWFYALDVTGTKSIIDKGGLTATAGFRLELIDDRVAFTVRHGGVDTQIFFPADTVLPEEWNHVVITWDGTTARMYLNKVLVATSTDADAALEANAHSILFGAANDFSNPWNGNLAEFAAYDYALAEARIERHFDMAVAEDYILLFAGTVMTVDQDYEDQTDQLVWRVNAVDFIWRLNKYRPFGTYHLTSVTDIVKDMVTRFAPGFTTNHVQTNLAKINITFDGTDDFATALTRLANAIGGGVWYVDYNWDIHFFHRIPEGFVIPDAASDLAQLSEMHIGTGTPMDVDQPGDTIPGFNGEQATTGIYVFWSTFILSNGLETSPSPWSNLVSLDGTLRNRFQNIPTGPPGTRARKIYYRRWGGVHGAGGSVASHINTARPKFYCEIRDNVTTSFTDSFFGQGATSSAVVPHTQLKYAPPITVFSPPPGAANPMTATVNESGVEVPFPFESLEDDFQDLAAGWRTRWVPTKGFYRFMVIFLYRNGTYSKRSILTPAIEITRTFQYSYVLVPPPVGPPYQFENGFPVGGHYEFTVLDEGQSVDFDNIPIGPEVNGVDCIARLIYGSYLGLEPDLSNPDVLWTDNVQNYLDPSYTKLWWVIGDNTTTSASQLGPILNRDPYELVLAQANIDDGGGEPEAPPVWPNPDGPNPEETLPQPTLVSDSSPFLLKDPPFRTSVDLSQVRNRIYVKGSGSSLAAKAYAGDNQLVVADVGAFSPSGGQILAGAQKLRYSAVQQVQVEFENSAGAEVSFQSYSGQGVIFLSEPLEATLFIGAPVSNFLQVDNVPSQEFLAKFEKDRKGQPTDGVHEYTVVDTTLKTPFQLYVRAQAELELFSKPIVSVHYATRDPNTRAGAQIDVQMTNPPCKGRFMIQDVSIDQIHDEVDEDWVPRYQVTASSVKFNLEDLLLLILGGKGIAFDPGFGVNYSGIIPSSTGQGGTIFQSAGGGGATILETNLSLTTLDLEAGGDYVAVPAVSGKIIKILAVVIVMTRFDNNFSNVNTTGVFKYANADAGGAKTVTNNVSLNYAGSGSIGRKRVVLTEAGFDSGWNGTIGTNDFPLDDRAIVFSIASPSAANTAVIEFAAQILYALVDPPT